MRNNAAFCRRLLEVIEHSIIPATRAGVAAGNKIFGAAILRKSDLSLVLAETNNETENPLWHGEIHALKRLYEMPREMRPAPGDSIFLATHEPCSLCLSAITWAGYDNFYYLFSHEDSRDSFAIPHDLRILKEVFNLDPGGYNSQNAYWNSYSIQNLTAEMENPQRDELMNKIKEIAEKYQKMSEIYQKEKNKNEIPLN